MTNNEMNKLRERRTIREVARTIYVVSDIAEMYDYLYAKVDAEIITEEEADDIVEKTTKEYANMRQYQRNEIINLIEKARNEKGDK